MVRRALVGALAAVVLWTAPALALEAPKWVAAMYLEAQGQVGLRWIPVAGATGYKVLRSTTPGAGYQEVASPAQPQYLDPVTPGSTYYYVLQAVAASEASPNSLERSVTVAQAVQAPPPELLNAEMDQNANAIRLVWKTAAGAVAYNIYRRESFKPAGKEDLLGSVPTADPYFDKANLKKGIEYIYSVTVLDSSFNESPKSTTKSAKFTPKEEKKVVAKTEEKVVDNRKVQLVGAAKYVPGENQVRPGSINAATVVYCDGEVYVHFTSGEILVFSEDLSEFKRRLIGGDKEHFPALMNSFVCGYDDDLLGVFWQTREVMQISRKDGTILSRFTVDDGLDPNDPRDKQKPKPSRVSWRDDEIYVGDANNHAIRVFTRRGKLLRRIGGFGLEAGKFSYNSDMVFTKEGNLGVLEAANARVQVFDKDDKSVLMFGESGKRVGQFARAAALAYDPRKNLFYVGDFLSSVIHVWTVDGKVAGVIKFADQKEERGFNSVASVAVGDNGLLYAIDYGLSEVLAMRDEN